MYVGYSNSLKIYSVFIINRVKIANYDEKTKHKKKYRVKQSVTFFTESDNC